jgi:DNA primase catalytic core
MAFIKKEFIETLLESAHIDKVIGHFIELKRAGANLKAKSPFQTERTGSLMVSTVKNIWKDFSSGKGGNMVNFVMEHESCDYPEAIKIIAGICNMQVEYEVVDYSPERKIVMEKKETLRKVLNLVWDLYKAEFTKLPEDHAAAKEVFQKREYNNEVVIDWGIGYAPENFLHDKLKASGYIKEGEDLGLIVNQWDKYSNRVIYPIHDANGLLIGLAGRDVSGKDNTAKWINPTVNATNLLYNKSKVWYGFHKAKIFIRKRGEAFITEGYNDIIGFQECGLENTVSASGTAISDDQINIIKKHTTKVVFCFDPDKAGKKATLELIPRFIKAGFRTQVINLDIDPDDFTRKYKDIIAISGLENMFNEPNVRVDGFKILMDEKLQGTEINKSFGAKYLCEVIASIQDDYIVEVYKKWLAKESKITATKIKIWIKEFQDEKVLPELDIAQNDFRYELPKKVTIPFLELEKDITRYGIFMANNQTFIALPPSTDGKVNFTSISNFEIEIINHMRDEGRAKKLVRIKNTMNEEIIFDTDSNNFNALGKFVDMVTDHGDFRFKGNKTQLFSLCDFLFEKMGVGRKVDVLGWQPDGKFWCWNNLALQENGEEIPINENGILILNNVHYYIPSANMIYKNDMTKYPGQKRFMYMKNNIHFTLFLQHAYKVHREHIISSILFGFACLFRDVIIEKLGRFPILFLCGPGGTGKDEIIEIVQGLTGIPQSPINLEANISTAKGAVRSTAQFRNGISLLSEYKRGNREHDGMIKQFYDNVGYTKGNLDSHISTDYVPIESSIILTGNDFPDAEPLIQRLIWNEMDKNRFSAEETIQFDLGKDMMKNGMSSYAHEILKHRVEIINEFDKVQRNWKEILKERFPEAKERMVANLSILSAFFQILRDKQLVVFPFTQDEMIAHFGHGINNQLRRINSGSILNKFWDVFIACLRGPLESRITLHREINIESNLMYIQWSRTYGIINKQWWQMYHEAPPTKTTLLEQVEVAKFIKEKVASYSFDTGRQAVRSSAIVIDMNKMSEILRDDIIMSASFQMNEGSLFEKIDGNTEAILPDSAESIPELPF